MLIAQSALSLKAYWCWNLYDGGVIKRRRAKSQLASASFDNNELTLPEGITDVLSIVDAEYLILAPGEVVLQSSSGVGALSLIKDGRLNSDRLVALVRAVRRSGVYQEATVELPRGPVGAGTHDLLVRVTPVGNHGLVITLIFDDSELRRLDSVRRDFVANISHELKTPIGALSILSEAVLGASDDPQAIVKFASRMQLEAKRLTNLVQEIINLSRLQDDDPLKNAQILSLHDLINEAIDGSRLTADARNISLAFGESPTIKVLGDHNQIRMAISNLIENAINYSPDGTRVAISLISKNGLAEISISDQGLGIPEKDLERVFERFYRVDPARSRATGGTGLGLSIVKHVVTIHGGDISLWSVEGAGSTFTIRLPAFIESAQVISDSVSTIVEANK